MFVRDGNGMEGVEEIRTVASFHRSCSSRTSIRRSVSQASSSAPKTASIFLAPSAPETITFKYVIPTIDRYAPTAHTFFV